MTLKLYDFDVKNMKTFHLNDVEDPRDVAMAGNRRLHDISDILTHQGEVSKPIQLKFHVQYMDGDLRWETYTKLKDNLSLHEYLTKMGGIWESLIPIEFTNDGEHYSERHPSKQKAKEPKRVTIATLPERTSKRIRKEPPS